MPGSAPSRSRGGSRTSTMSATWWPGIGRLSIGSWRCAPICGEPRRGAPCPISSLTRRRASRGASRSFFFDGRRAGLASFDTPKAVGEPIGRVVRVDRTGFVLDRDHTLTAGDGICFGASRYLRESGGGASGRSPTAWRDTPRDDGFAQLRPASSSARWSGAACGA